MASSKYKRICELYDKGVIPSVIAVRLAVSTDTVYRALRENRAERQQEKDEASG
jgi:DNA invertase Pin-like site-specific DNA recombinase